jgi:hypothetical protein
MAAVLIALGCGDDATPGRDSGVARDSGTTSDGGGGSDAARADGGGTSDAGPMIGECPVDSVALDVNVIGGGAPSGGRLVVAWGQLDDDGPDPIPDVAYDVQFDTTATMIEIPIASLTPPTEPNLLCERDCDDESICPCLSDPRVGFGLVAVVDDANGSGSIEPEEVRARPRGVGYVVVGSSAMRYVPAPETPSQWRTIFPEGIEGGICPYRIIDTESFDRPGLVMPGARFDLNVCSAAMPMCDLPLPNLT